MSTVTKLLLLSILITLPFNIFAEDKSIELAQLDGDWKGTGTFIMPVTDIEMDITGLASFRYDESANRLRTSLTGEKFMFTYSDSGYVTPDFKGDSLTWEVWDNFKRHALYRGAIDGDKITGSRLYKGKTYSVEIRQPHADTVSFNMTVTPPNGETINKATFSLWRIK